MKWNTQIIHQKILELLKVIISSFVNPFISTWEIIGVKGEVKGGMKVLFQN